MGADGHAVGRHRRQRLDDHLAGIGQNAQGTAHRRPRHTEQLGAARDERFERVVNMPLIGELVQKVDNARLNAHGRVAGEAQLAGDAVCGDETDAEDVRGQPVGVLPHHFKRCRPVVLVYLHRVGGADAMTQEKLHHRADLPLGVPGLTNQGHAFGSDAGHFGQAIGVLFDDLQGRLAEVGHDAARHGRTDAAYEARAQVLANPLNRGRHGGLVMAHLKLLAEAGMLNPAPAQAQHRAGGRQHEIADDSDQLGTPPDL